MSSLAHEGNPKEDEIIITGGSVLSTAQLDVDFLFLGLGGTPNIPAVVEPAFTRQSSSCSDVFEWIGINEPTTSDPTQVRITTPFMGRAQGLPWINWSDSPCLSTNGVRTRWFGGKMRLQINSTKHCYGMLWSLLYPTALPGTSTTSACGSVITYYVGFNGIIDGTPRAGPAIWMEDESDKDAASVYALVIDMDNQSTKLMVWNDNSLSLMDNATILGTMNTVPSVGDILGITMSQRPDSVGFNFINADIHDSTFSTTKDFIASVSLEVAKPYNNTQVRHSRCSVGFVSIGGTTSGKMEFKSSDDESCWNGLVPWVDVDSSGGTG